MEEIWIRKYAPKNSRQVVGQDKGMAILKEFLLNFNQERRRGLLIYGPTGCGKSAAVHALAAELGLELLELNASDFRNKEQINAIAGSASRQLSLFQRGKLILLDEIDGSAGNEDRGGIQAIAELITGSAFPVVLTANDPFDKRFSALRRVVKMVEFKRLGVRDVQEILARVCRGEGIKATPELLEGLARRADGDARAAILDLFVLASKEKELGGLEGLAARERELDIEEVGKRILKTSDARIALDSIKDLGEEPEEMVLWLEENLPREYTNKEEIANGFDMLSRADVQLGRIKRRQHWRLLAYAQQLLAAGVALAKQEKHRGAVEYRESQRRLKIWIWNRKNQLRASVAEKLARATHCSVGEAQQEILPYLRQLFKQSKGQRELLSEQLGLDEQEQEWLSG